MIPIWGFSKDNVHSLESYAAAMPGLQIKAAETRHITNAFDGDDLRGGAGQDAYAAFVRATKQ